MPTLRRIFKVQEQHGTGGTHEGSRWSLWGAEVCGFRRQRRVVSAVLSVSVQGEWACRFRVNGRVGSG